MGDQTVSRLSRSVIRLDPAEDKPDLVTILSKLSPDLQSSLHLLIQNIIDGKVDLNTNDDGQQFLEYPENRKQSCDDASQANTIVKSRSEEDFHVKTTKWSHLLNYMKKKRSPMGVVPYYSEIPINHGKYREGHEFERTDQVLGNGRFAGDIMVVTDNKTKHQHALKTIMIAFVRVEEIECLKDLANTGFVPSLLLFNIVDYKVNVHMEILKNALTMRSILDDGKMQELGCSLLKPFSFYVLNETLEAVSAMHGKNWVHRDLHAGNVMLQMSPEKVLVLRIIDFGMASKRETRSTGLDFRGIRSDIASLLRIFCSLFVSIEYNGVYDIQTNWKEGLKQVTGWMGLEEKDELFRLMDLAIGIVNLEDISKLSEQVRKHLNKALSDIGQTEKDVLKQVVSLLVFPEQIQETKGFDTVELDEEDGIIVHQ